MTLLDLDNFRRRPEDRPIGTKCRRPPRHKDGEWFLKGPIPGSWLSRAMRGRKPTIVVALAIWYLAGVQKSDTVSPTWQTWRQFSIHPDTGRRGLLALERDGLVTVVRCRGRCPVVTILEVEYGL